MKIPFERTIASAYRFAFTNVLSVIGIGWFPYLLVTALCVGLAVLLYPGVHGLWLDDRKTIDTAKLMTTIVPAVGAFLLVFLALLVAQAMVTVGLMRKALGQHPGPVFIFFSLGGQVWKLIGSYILMLLLICGGIMLAALAIGAVGVVLNQVAQKVQPLVLGVLIFVAVLGYFYSVVRLSFFIPAVVVAEDHIGLRRSWHLGRGNFWRIFGISLIVSLPIQLAVSTISSTMMQIAMVPGLGLQPGPMTDAQGQKFVADLLDALRRVGPYYAILQILYFALLSGLTTGAVANAYKAVAGEGSADMKGGGMNKIPVGETIRFAYAFTFGEIGTVIGLVWIPLVINAVGAFLVERGLGDAEPAAGAALPSGFGYFALYSIVAVFLVAMVAVAITRQALGLRQGPAIAMSRFGTAELHVFGGIAGLYLLFFIFAMGLTLAVVVVGGLAATLSPSKAVGEAVTAGAGSLAALAGLGAIFYALVRLSFLFVPSCVVGGGFGLSRSWELTRGNFWRVVAVGAATALPAMLVAFAVNLLILGPDYIASIAAMFRDQWHLAKYAASNRG